MSAEIAQLLYREARLLDERRYEEWLALFTHDARYWCPSGDDNADPLRQVSIIFDDAARMAERVFRLEHGPAFAQDPPSRTRRLIANVECEGGDGEKAPLVVRSNFLLVAVRRDQQDVWAGHNEHHLRKEAGAWRFALKKVSLVNNAAPLGNLAFLL